LATYVWYAFAVGAAERASGANGRLYCGTSQSSSPWMGFGRRAQVLLFPPLSIEFLRGNQLDEAQRRRTNMYLRRVD